MYPYIIIVSLGYKIYCYYSNFSKCILRHVLIATTELEIYDIHWIECTWFDKNKKYYFLDFPWFFPFFLFMQEISF